MANPFTRAREQAYGQMLSLGVQPPVASPPTGRAAGFGNGVGIIWDAPGTTSEIRIGQTALTILAVSIIGLAAFNLWTHDFQK